MDETNRYPPAAHLERARTLLEQAGADPIRAQKLAAEAALELRGVRDVPWTRDGAYRIWRVPPAPAPLVPAVPAPVSPGVEVPWSGPGWVLAMYGTTIGDASVASMASASVQVTMKGGQKDLTLNGTAGDFALFSALFPTNAPWFPLLQYVTGVDTKWIVRYRNEAPLGGPTITPIVFFAWRPDEDK